MDGTVTEKNADRRDADQRENHQHQLPAQAMDDRERQGFEKALNAPIQAGRAPSPIIPTDTAQVARYANFVAANNMAPPSYKSQGQIAIAIMKGLEVGLAPLQALQAFYVVNNIPAWYGDGAWAQAISTRQVKDFVTTWDPEQDDGTATCIITREGLITPVERTFSLKEAGDAGLLRDTRKPWSKYPKRMCMMRARLWAIRDAFADALFGMPIAEEIATVQPGYDLVPDRHGNPMIIETDHRVENALSDEGVPDVDGDDSDIEEAEIIEVEADEVSDGEPDVDDVTDDEPDVDEQPDYEAKLAALKAAVADANKLDDLDTVAAEHAIAEWPKDWNRKAVAWLKKAEAELKK